MASDGLPDGEQASPSWALLGPLPGTFLGPALGIQSESLYELVLDIPDVIGLRALRPDAAAVKVKSVRNSQCIRVVTPDDHVTCGYHEILLHDMGEEELPFVSLRSPSYLAACCICVYDTISAGSGTQTEVVQGTFWLHPVWKLYTLW